MRITSLFSVIILAAGLTACGSTKQATAVSQPSSEQQVQQLKEQAAFITAQQELADVETDNYPSLQTNKSVL